MAKQDSINAIDRGLLLLNLLDQTQRTRKQVHEMLIERGYSISEKSVERDLNRLVDLFPRHVSYIKKFPPYGYRLRQATKMSLMTPEEATSVLTAFEYLNPLIPKLAESLGLYINEAKSVLEKNYSSNYKNWKNKISVKNEGFQLEHKDIGEGILSNIHEALLKGMCINAQYQSRATKETKLYENIYPIGLVHCGRLIYLVGAHDKIGSKRFGWPLNRFKKIELTDNINPQHEEKIEDHINDGRLGFLLSSEDLRVVLKFEKNAGFIFEETPTSKKMKMYVEDDAVIIEDVLPYNFELENWILGFAERVEVMEPLELKEKIVSRLKMAVKKYE